MRERVCECNSAVTVGEKSLMFISVRCAESILIGNSDTFSPYLVVARLHTRLIIGVTIFPLPAGKVISMVCLVLEEIVWFAGSLPINPKSQRETSLVV